MQATPFRLFAVLTSICAFLSPIATFAQGGPPGGVVRDILIADADREILFAATDGGVFRSEDAGRNWSKFSDGLPDFAVNQIVGRPDKLFAALDGGGVYRSVAGQPWEFAGDGIGDPRVLSLTVSPDDSDVLLAGTSTLGIFFSNNAGNGWIRAGAGPTTGGYPAIAFAPNDGQRVFAAGNSTGSGILIESVDGGQNWTVSVSGNVAFREIRFDPGNPDIVYVATSIGLLRRPGANLSFESLASASAFAILDVAVDRNDSSTVYLSTEQFGMLISRDSGATWATTGGMGLPRALILTIRPMAETPTRLLAGLSGTGVFESTDQGANWALRSRGLRAAGVLNVQVDPNNSNIVFASVEGGGMFRSDNGGDTWEESRNGLFVFEPSELVIDPADSNRMYVGSVNPFNSGSGALLRSLDAGATWETRVQNLPILSLAVDPNDGRTLWAGSTTGAFGGRPPLLLSRDGGESFEGVVGDDGILFDAQTIRDIAVAPDDPRNLVLATYSAFQGGFAIWSDDNGDEFRASFSTNVQPPGAIAIDPTDPTRIFLGTTPVSSGDQTANGTIFRSDDRGRTFTLKNSGLPAELRTINAIVVDPNDGAVYASTGLAVYRSDDAGESWTEASSGIRDLGIQNLSVDPGRAGVLYAATLSQGVFRTNDRGQTWAPAAVPQMSFRSDSIVNAADFLAGGVPPGGIISIFGVGIGPSSGVQAGLDSSGRLPTELGGVRVFFNDVPAPLFFVRTDQVNCQVPFEVAGADVYRVRIEFAGSSRTVTVRAANHRPGIFNAALNQDYTVNSSDEPAAPGEVVQLFVTGQGVVSPSIETGKIAPSAEPFPRPTGEVIVTVDGRPAVVQFAGLAPGFVGLLQVNIFLPEETDSGEQNVVVRIGGRASAKAGTIHVE